MDIVQWIHDIARRFGLAVDLVHDLANHDGVSVEEARARLFDLEVQLTRVSRELVERAAQGVRLLPALAIQLAHLRSIAIDCLHLSDDEIARAQLLQLLDDMECAIAERNALAGSARPWACATGEQS